MRERELPTPVRPENAISAAAIDFEESPTGRCGGRREELEEGDLRVTRRNIRFQRVTRISTTCAAPLPFLLSFGS